MSIFLSWQAYVEFLLKMNQVSSPEKAVERASAKLEKTTGKGLTFKEQNEFLRQFYKVNPYRKRYDR